MKRNYLWMTWGLISLIALILIGYESIASEVVRQEDQSRPVIITSASNPR